MIPEKDRQSNEVRTVRAGAAALDAAGARSAP